MAASGMKDIRRRIKSVESTMQITKAMELVASSKLRKAKERAEKARPFFNKLYETMAAIAAGNRDFTSTYTGKTDEKKPLYIVIAGDRGLAGGYNANVFRLAEAQMGEKDAGVIAIGNKAVDYYTRHGRRLLGSFGGVAEDFDGRQARVVSDLVLDAFSSGEADAVYLIFTQFVSGLTQEASVLKMLPLTFLPDEAQIRRQELVIYEPSPEAVFDLIVPQYITGMLYGGVVESFASEQAARRTAMEAANDNASEMIDSLSLAFNRARQGAITQEITEIVSGANAAGK